MITEDALMAYLDGEASPEQRRLVEAALSSNPQLRARVAKMEACDQTIRGAFDSLLERAVPDRLISAARTEAAGKILPFHPRRPVGAVSNVIAAFRRRPALVGWLAVGQAAVIAVTAMATLSVHPAEHRPQFTALGAPPRSAAANAVVIFDPRTPEEEMRGTLLRVDARIVGGPTAAGAYLLQTPQASRDDLVRTLKARKGVMLEIGRAHV